VPPCVGLGLPFGTTKGRATTSGNSVRSRWHASSGRNCAVPRMAMRTPGARESTRSWRRGWRRASRRRGDAQGSAVALNPPLTRPSSCRAAIAANLVSCRGNRARSAAASGSAGRLPAVRPDHEECRTLPFDTIDVRTAESLRAPSAERDQYHNQPVSGKCYSWRALFTWTTKGHLADT